jgi:hypothetical protein
MDHHTTVCTHSKLVWCVHAAVSLLAESGRIQVRRSQASPPIQRQRPHALSWADPAWACVHTPWRELRTTCLTHRAELPVLIAVGAVPLAAGRTRADAGCIDKGCQKGGVGAGAAGLASAISTAPSPIPSHGGRGAGLPGLRQAAHAMRAICRESGQPQAAASGAASLD